MPWLPSTGTGYHTNIWVNGAQMAGRVDWSTLRIEDSGNHEVGQASFTVTDISLVASAVVDEAFVEIVDALGHRFKGFIKNRKVRLHGPGRHIDVTARGIEGLLDTIIVVSNVRPAGESDKARIQYFLATYGNQGLYNNAFGSTDTSKIQTLNASLPKQRFKTETLRQVVEKILGLASDTADYYLDNLGRLHTFDATNTESLTAPYVMRVGTPGAGEVAPEDEPSPDIEWDTDTLVNDYWVTAGKRSADVRVADAVSIARYGRRAGFVDAPDADTVAKAEAVGNAALKDNAYPKVRGGFSVSSPYDKSGSKVWENGQMVTLHSAAHDLSGEQSRITGVEWEYVTGDGGRKASVRFGGDRLRLRSGGSAKNVSGGSVQGDIG